MAVTTDELQVETRAPAAASSPAGGGAAKALPQSDTKAEIRAETERMHERELRLRAD